MNKIRKGDQVVVLAGRNKGAAGTVRKVLMGADGKPERVTVEGVNTVTHFTRPNPQKNEPGGMIKREAPLHVSNVAVAHPDSGGATRVKIIIGEKGRERSFHVGSRRQS